MNTVTQCKAICRDLRIRKTEKQNLSMLQLMKLLSEVKHEDKRDN